MKRFSVLALLALGACSAQLPHARVEPAWSAWIGAPASELTALLGPTDDNVTRADGRVLIYRRSRVIEARFGPSAIERDFSRQAATPPARIIELCETRVVADALGVVTGVDQSGAGCSELGPAPPARGGS